ncbi:unnamed protein product [Symbiodinium natans]|uniref:Uncharacterized protein n=1 Tax=Symbiodinium natans TaxID=878477 RepID=A0A812P9G8_9DINO|nr:unnamed protein product [Symbiodinium natans]
MRTKAQAAATLEAIGYKTSPWIIFGSLGAWSATLKAGSESTSRLGVVKNILWRRLHQLVAKFPEVWKWVREEFVTLETAKKMLLAYTQVGQGIVTASVHGNMS